MRRYLLLYLGLSLIAGLSLMAGLALATDVPSSKTLFARSSPDTTKILDRHGRLLYEVLDPRSGRRTRLSLQEIPLPLRQAVLAVEDANFYQHPGVDPIGVIRAAWQALRAGRVVSGGSTITQQLARNLLLSQEERESRSLIRKLREMLLALRLTQAYSKDAILEMYLNEVYFGHLAYGVEAAAQTYFGKPARELDLAEAALLAGLIQSPAEYDPLVHLDAARNRQKAVLSLMVKAGYISQEEADLAWNEPLHFVAGSAAQTAIRAPHFVAYVLSLLEAELGPEMVQRGGLRVLTSLDLDLQQQAEAAIRRQLAELSRRTREEGAPDYNVHNAALVALDPQNGQILAMVGSADYFAESIDGAVNVALANRQPGSAIKPVTYAAAFSRGLTPATVIADVPKTFITKEGYLYAPENYDRLWHGPISLRRALATSSNMVAVRVLDRIGLPAMLEMARALGITTFSDPERFGLALTLGGGEVKLLELTAAYGAFANGGKRVQPVAILSVESKDGPVAGPWGATSGGEQVLSPQVAYLITDILSDDAARLPAFGPESVLNLSRPAAAKTGTTTDFRDNWTIGYTPDLVAGVWVGNADNSPMYRITGITGAGPIWHNFMEEALKDRPPRAFPRPEGLVEVEICETSGLLPTEYCPRRRTELFIAGTEPVQYDDSYQALAIDAATGLLWAEGCLGPKVQRVYRLLPPEAQEWGRQQGILLPPQGTCNDRETAAYSQQEATTKVAVAGDNRPADVGMMPSASSGAPRLLITSPAPGAIFAISPEMPSDRQQLEIAAIVEPSGTAVGSLISSVTILLDGQPLATIQRPPYRLLWPLHPGRHFVQAIGWDAGGHRLESQQVWFTVE